MFNKEKSDSKINSALIKSVNLIKRSKTIEWLIIISFYFKLLEKTIALAVECFDIYVVKNQDGLASDEYMFIGLASLFMASKYEEIYPPSAQVYTKSYCDKLSGNDY